MPSARLDVTATKDAILQPNLEVDSIAGERACINKLLNVW